MIIDERYSERYLTLSDCGLVTCGWQHGWDLFNAGGTPVVVSEIVAARSEDCAAFIEKQCYPIDLPGLWPDTEHYEQNSPGIMERAGSLAGRAYRSPLEAAFWLNALRVPVSAAYLAACAKVLPDTILELGTGGDSAHSTGMFLYWLEQTGWRDERISTQRCLVSVDRHPLSHAWPRYREAREWTFIQGDSLGVLHAILRGDLDVALPKWYDLIFIDTIHTLEATRLELAQCCGMTDAILMDDLTTDEVAEAVGEFLAGDAGRDWLRVDLAFVDRVPAVALLERHPHG